MDALPPGLAPPPIRNQVLAGLPQDALDLLRPYLARVMLVSNQTLSEPGEAVEHVHFIERGVVALTADTGADDTGIAVGMVGPEGMVGTAALLGAHPVAFHRTVVQIPGSALRMPAARFRHCLDRVPSLRERCLLHLEALGIQISQTGACNGRHPMLERCASWLLAVCDRSEEDDFPMTHDAMAAVLGVTRPSMTVSLGLLQRAGCIRSSHGKVTVLDRAGLEGNACGCYRLVRKQFDRLLMCS